MAVADTFQYISKKLHKLFESENQDGAATAARWLEENTQTLTATLTDDVLNQQATNWLTWAKSHKNVKIVSADVPEGILPSGLKGRLHDVKVFCRGPDDAIYDRDIEIRKKVARGNCFLELDCGASHRQTTCVIYALNKFTGGLGDDDDRDAGDDLAWKMYFTKPLESTARVVCTSKMNGEAAHLGVERINDEYFLCAGSKNVHMIFRNRDDLSRYDASDFRYSIAREVCLCLLDSLDSMSPEVKQRLFEFLHWTQFTSIFEILNPDHPHVEDFSHLPAPQLKFITWTSCDLDQRERASFSCMPPDVALEIASVLGLSPIDYEVIAVDGLDLRMAQIRKTYGKEGEVLCFLDDSDVVIGMLKKKSIWYIIVRAIREKVRTASRVWSKSPDTFSLSASTKKLVKRIGEIEKWLQLDPGTTAAWTSLGSKCLAWCLTELDAGQLTATDLENRFPVCWRRFLTTTGSSDRIQTPCGAQT